jgi:hypothetical protein
MKLKIPSSRRIVVYAGVSLLISGGFTGYLYWGVEPQESIGGFLCGLGVCLILLSNVTLKKK